MGSNEKQVAYRNLKVSLFDSLVKETKRKSIFSTTDSIEHSTKITKINASKRTSIFFNVKNSAARTDIYGNSIMKGSKSHKVSFIDNISNKKIAEVIMVDQPFKKKEERVTLNCASSCLIF